jgi:large subunit ribosomal protein L15
MPLKQRVPKLKGFNNPFRVEYSAVNLHTLADLEESKVTPALLVERGVVRKGAFVKILARGEITSKVDVHAHAVSKAAESAITAAGGSVTLIPLPFREEGKAGRPPVQGNQFANR